MNYESMSNGSLMKITPLAVWGANLKDLQDVKDMVVADVEFLHPNPLA